MSFTSVVEFMLTFNLEEFILPALDDLSDADLMQRPNDQCNPIGWLFWHQTRAEDRIVSMISDVPEVWFEHHWYEKFGLPADDGAYGDGIGHTLEQVAAFTSTKETLKAYATAVRAKTLAALRSLTPADLEREVRTVRGKYITGERYLKSLMVDYNHHTGQVSYLRGYLKGRWDPPYTQQPVVRLEELTQEKQV